MACCLIGSLKSAEAEAALFYEKLKGAEKALKKCMQEEAAGRQQAAADQEIISFLDLKVIILLLMFQSHSFLYLAGARIGEGEAGSSIGLPLSPSVAGA